jgi:hypothetical protein
MLPCQLLGNQNTSANTSAMYLYCGTLHTEAELVPVRWAPTNVNTGMLQCTHSKERRRM